MRHSFVPALALAIMAASVSSAAARPRSEPSIIVCTQQGCATAQPPADAPAARATAMRGSKPASVAGDQRPSLWCAWFLRRHLGIPRSAFPNGAYNQARAFAHIGTPAAGPAPGVIVVWGHHVGVIEGPAPDGEWIITSGNDGHAVRTRARSIRGAIAFRWPPGRGFAAL